MSDSLFREGGPHKIRRVGENTYLVALDVDASDGMIGRSCPSCETSYFRVKLGTGITEGQTVAFCPYCRYSTEPGKFMTKAQLDNLRNIAINEIQPGLERMVRKAFGVGPTGETRFGGGFLSMRLTFKPAPRRPVMPLVEEELRRDVQCPHCGLEHAVFGLATWCADCGEDIFLTHVSEEFAVIKKMLSAADARRESLGARVATRDVENALEDTVSTFETVLKAITRRFLLLKARTSDEIEVVVSRQVGNKFQNVESARAAFKEVVGVDLYASFQDQEIVSIRRIFEKRHPLTHNLGVVDRRYTARSGAAGPIGREVTVQVRDVESAIEFALSVIRATYRELFSENDSTSGTSLEVSENGKEE